MGEAQEIERTGALPTGRTLTRTPGRLAEGHQPGFVRVKGQAVLRESLREHGQNPSGIALHLEDQHGIVSVADQMGTSVKTWLDRVDEPRVEYLVKVGIGEDRGHHASNNPAKSLPELKTSISRAKLRPGYGQGFGRRAARPNAGHHSTSGRKGGGDGVSHAQSPKKH
jgi:hypothetical protein